ncbi:MAG: PAS domain-containing sensor histidine kinase [Peptococcaceae bacterium]|nr:PAS domain-containing sensor histidine kinase [Peptococcaceae bacterium]
MNSGSEATRFAPAERAPAWQLEKQSKEVENLYRACSFLNALPNVVMVLNRQRQVVFCNRVLLDLLGAGSVEEVRGSRPGELLRCVHARETAGGCGTSEFCRTCGAVNAILDSQWGRQAYRECRITVVRDGRLECLDMGVTAIPFRDGHEEFTVLSMVDISGEKRRRALERIFFHDVMNTAGGLLGLAELLEDTADPALLKEFLLDIRSSAKLLVEQIREQYDLLQAENNELKVIMEPVHALSLLRDVAAACGSHEVSRGRQIVVDPASADVCLVSSRRLLYRVLGNMLKNALEACGAGETVRLGCRLRGGQVEFWVNNPGVIPREVQLQLFQRSFSTKGNGRGLGTYSIKLLTERYLHGTVSFTVSEDEGTTFFARYPLKAPGAV